MNIREIVFPRNVKLVNTFGNAQSCVIGDCLGIELKHRGCDPNDRWNQSPLKAFRRGRMRKFLDVSGRKLEDVLSRTLPSAYPLTLDHDRPYLTSVFITDGAFVANNTHTVIAVKPEFKWKWKEDIVLQTYIAKPVFKLLKTLKVHKLLGGEDGARVAMFKGRDTIKVRVEWDIYRVTYVSNYVAHDYPDYRQMLPDSPTTTSFMYNDIRSVLSLIRKSNAKWVTLWPDGELNLFPDNGTVAVVSCSRSGEHVSCGRLPWDVPFNTEFEWEHLNRVLSAFKGRTDRIYINASAPGAHWVFTDGSVTGVVPPAIRYHSTQ